MGRLHLFELEDQAWFPGLIRGFGTDVLQFNQTAIDQSKPLAAPMAAMAAASDAPRFVDLCSGSSGPWLRLAEGLEAEGCALPVSLTDRFPNPEACASAVEQSGGRLSLVEEPVDATDVPESLAGVRTLFNGMHHFRPEEAKAILRSAAERRQPIVVGEFLRRGPLAILGMPIAAFLVTPIITLFIRPVRLSRFVFTWLLPVVPLMVLWDGIVSCLRIYSPAELDALVADIDVPGYRFESVLLKNPTGPIPITCLFGGPDEVIDALQASPGFAAPTCAEAGARA